MLFNKNKIEELENIIKQQESIIKRQNDFKEMQEDKISKLTVKLNCIEADKEVCLKKNEEYAKEINLLNKTLDTCEKLYFDEVNKVEIALADLDEKNDEIYSLLDENESLQLANDSLQYELDEANETIEKMQLLIDALTAEKESFKESFKSALETKNAIIDTQIKEIIFLHSEIERYKDIIKDYENYIYNQ